VKIYLLFNNQRIAKKKTHVKKRTLNPVFNESFVFDLPKSEDGLASVQLEFMLLDWDRVTKNEVSNVVFSINFLYQRVQRV
jgi:Ca2+-dependent lipid-binding protein